MNFHNTIEKFSNKDFVPKGWYWLAESKKIKKGKALPIEFRDKKLVLYRGHSGKTFALDAQCPHMGAHLCDGKIEEDSIRCPFHRWKFDSEGQCTDIPVQKDTKNIPQIPSYTIQENYGLIWIWTGDKNESTPLPIPEELEGQEVDFTLGKPFEKNCHPNVVMINAIDAHHFSSVHQLVVDLNMEPAIRDEFSIAFNNTTPCPDDHILFGRFKQFYKNALTYNLKYWWGHVGSVTLGPDFLHFHIIFALRPGDKGQTQGQTILVTKKRSGLTGKVINSLLLKITKIVGNYFAKGDTLIFEKIQFEFRSPVHADRAILRFIRHYEQMEETSWNSKRLTFTGATKTWTEDTTPETHL